MGQTFQLNMEGAVGLHNSSSRSSVQEEQAILWEEEVPYYDMLWSTVVNTLIVDSLLNGPIIFLAT